jgi:hypothetical protein
VFRVFVAIFRTICVICGSSSPSPPFAISTFSFILGILGDLGGFHFRLAIGEGRKAGV